MQVFCVMADTPKTYVDISAVTQSGGTNGAPGITTRTFTKGHIEYDQCTIRLKTTDFTFSTGDSDTDLFCEC